MSSLRTLRRRIKSVQNIRGITKAMEMISAVRFRRIEQRFKKSIPYMGNLEKLMFRLLSPALVENHPLFRPGEPKSELLVVFTGDRGLCGSFNTQLLRQTQAYLQENSTRPITLLPVGKVGAGFVKRRGWPMAKQITDIGYRFTPESLKTQLDEIAGWYLEGKYDAVNFFFMHYLRSGESRLQMEPFLGLNYLFDKKAESKETEDLYYIHEPDVQSTLERLLQLYVRQRFFMAFLGSTTAEYNARMVAMRLATDNAGDVIEQLTLLRNKVRQAMITREISEIIGGANALN